MIGFGAFAAVLSEQPRPIQLVCGAVTSETACQVMPVESSAGGVCV